MIYRSLKILFAAAALAYSVAPAVASPSSDTSAPHLCSKPAYPRRSLMREEEGVIALAFLIRADGTVNRTVILSSSGSAALDEATVNALSKCVFNPLTAGGKAIDTWVAVQYVWSIEGHPGLASAMRKAADAAKKGDVAARYNLGLLLLANANTDTEREQALALLRSAAELGYAPAQFDLGRRYEKGYEMNVDIDEALRWYQKAAAQGDVLAIQRMEVGVLPY